MSHVDESPRGDAPLSPLQISALMEIANTGSGHAAADLGDMLGKTVEISVPRAIASGLDEAIDMIGPVEQEVYAIYIDVSGDVDAALVALVTPEHAATLCGAVGLDHTTDIGQSMLSEIGNVVACSYAYVMREMSGLAFEVKPPQLVLDMLGALVSTLAASEDDPTGTVFLFDSSLELEGTDASINVLFAPTNSAVGSLLEAFGL
jgi:chemotaxis protein CheC